MPDDLPRLPELPAVPSTSPKPFIPPQGGPAFPLYPSHSCEGMTLRDYFAAAALTGYIAAYAGPEVAFPSDADAAKNAYDLADAMLARRGAK